MVDFDRRCQLGLRRIESSQSSGQVVGRKCGIKNNVYPTARAPSCDEHPAKVVSDDVNFYAFLFTSGWGQSATAVGDAAVGPFKANPLPPAEIRRISAKC